MSDQADELNVRVDEALAEVREEVFRAIRQHAPMHSPHEGYAVILEELDELWDEVKADRGRTPSGMHEATQVAAMGVRYLVDLDWPPPACPGCGDPADHDWSHRNG